MSACWPAHHALQGAARKLLVSAQNCREWPAAQACSMLARRYLLKVQCRSRSADAVVCVAAYKPLFLSKVADILLKNFLGERPGSPVRVTPDTEKCWASHAHLRWPQRTVPTP